MTTNAALSPEQRAALAQAYRFILSLSERRKKKAAIAGKK